VHNVCVSATITSGNAVYANQEYTINSLSGITLNFPPKVVSDSICALENLLMMKNTAGIFVPFTALDFPNEFPCFTYDNISSPHQFLAGPCYDNSLAGTYVFRL